MNQAIAILMQEKWVQCCVCGNDYNAILKGWGIPISTYDGLIVSNDFVGEWFGKPACKSCHDRHAQGEFAGEDTQF